MVTEVMGKIKALWRRAGNDAQNGASLAAIRVRNGANSGDDILSAIPPYF